MKKILATLVTLVMVMGLSVSAFAYTGDPTSYGYNYNNYGYNNGYGYDYNYNNYGYGYNYCSGVRQTYSDNEYPNDPWFDSYAEEYGVVFHLPPNMPITRSDVFAPVGKAMYQAYDEAGRNFTTSYGVNFVDFTWDRSLYEIAGGLYQRGIMIGYPEDNTVRFAKNITRAEFAKVVVLMARENGLVSYNNMTMSYEFPDMKDNWASQYASQCQALSLLIGREGEYWNPNTNRYERAYLFDPNANVTYQEYVTVMLRMSELANRSNYAVEFEDIAYGISSTMDIDFEGYEFDEDFDLSVSGSKTVYLSVGETKELKVKATPSDVELSKSDVNWEASKSGYVKFSNKSIEDDRYAVVEVKALKEGKLTVTASSRKDDDVEVEFNIVISDDEEYDDDDNEVYVTSITLNPTTVNLQVGESESISATVKPSNATDKGITWESHNTNVATVSQSGKITATGVGNTTVTATADDGSGVNEKIYVNVKQNDVAPKDIYVTSITLNPSSVNLQVGESESISATVKPSNATDKGIIWESHNTNVATVSQSGKITATGVGNTTVTATAKDGSGIVKTIDVTVKAEEVVSDNVAPEVQITGANVIKRDEFVTLTVTAYDDNLASFELKKSDILGMTGAGVSVHDIKKISNTEYKVVLLGMETAVGEICIAGGVAVDTAGNRSKETDGVAIKVNPLD